jgi:hypothetical protein
MAAACNNKILLELSKQTLTQEILKELIVYNEISGTFLWKVALSSSVDITREAGTLSFHGYRIITIANTLYRASQLAFLYMTGTIPAEIDHKDTNTLNDSWDNLRIATKNQNQHNKNIQCNNTSGVKGVSWHKRAGKWQAQVKLNGIYHSAGFFTDLSEATIAIQKLRTTLHGEFTNHG